jgi:signal peptidase I
VASGGLGRALLAIVVGLVALVLVLLVLSAVLGLKPYRVPSESMRPTFDVGDRFVASKESDPQRGDLVVLHPPTGAPENLCGVRHDDRSICPLPTRGTIDGVNFIRRVVALPGERVSIKGGRLVIGGKLQREPYVRVGDPSCEACNLPKPVTIPPDHYLTLGDNRSEAADDRFTGPVEKDSIARRARLRYWPLGKFGSP